MYKIYINDTPLMLINTKDVTNGPANDDKNMVTRYTGNHRMLLNYIDMLEKNTRFDTLTLFSENDDKLVEDFKRHYKTIEAAGGLVLNQKGEMLFIYRRGFWDLPKGKIDKGETPPIAAIREVQEETGIQEVTITKTIGETWHTYKSKKGKRILKKTYWYLMDTSETKLTPQVEEDIEIAEWIDVSAFLASDRKAYNSIDEMIKKVLHKN